MPELHLVFLAGDGVEWKSRGKSSREGISAVGRAKEGNSTSGPCITRIEEECGVLVATIGGGSNPVSAGCAEAEAAGTSGRFESAIDNHIDGFNGGLNHGANLAIATGVSDF